MPISPELMNILVCPACKQDVFEHEEKIYCTNEQCRRCYTIEDNIPNMLIEESKELSPEEWKQAMGNRSA
ncbi:MAG: Trm112 family protein [Candidatus Sumerlaeia bacterium]